MADQDSVLRIGIDSRPAEEGAARVERALRGVGEAAENATESVGKIPGAAREASQDTARAAQASAAAMEEFRRKTAQWDAEWRAKQAERARLATAAAAEQARAEAMARVEALERQFQLDMARIKEGQLRGFLAPAEARKAGQEAAMEFNRGLREVMDRASASGALRGRAGQDAFIQLAGSIKNVDEAGRAAGIGLGRLNATLVSVLRQATATNPAVAQLAATVGSLALSAAIMTGALAGLAALALAWNKLTEETRKNRRETEDAIRALEELAKRRELAARGPGGETESQIELARGRMAELEQVMARLQAITEAGLAGRERAEALAAQKRLEALRREYDELNRIVEAGEQELAEIRERATQSALASLVASGRATEAERRRATEMLDEARRAFEALADAEFSDDTLQKRAELIRQIDSLTGALERKTSAEREAAEQARRLREQSERQAAELSQQFADTERLTEAYRRGLDAGREMEHQLEREALLRRVARESTDAQRAANLALAESYVRQAEELRKAREEAERLDRERREAERRAAQRAEGEARFIRDLEAAVQEARMLADAHREGEEAIKRVNRELEVMRITQRAADEGWQLSEERVRELVNAIKDAREEAEKYERDRQQARKDEEDAARAARAMWEEAARGIQQALSASFEDVFTDGVQGFESFADQVLGMFQRLAAQIAAAMVADKLGITDLFDDAGRLDLSRLPAGVKTFGGAAVGGIVGARTGSAFAGMASGALTGAALGGPVGAALGAIGGAIGSLIGAGREAEEAARQAEAAREAWERAVSTLEELASPTGPLERMMDDARKAADAAAQHHGFDSFEELQRRAAEMREELAKLGPYYVDVTGNTSVYRAELERYQEEIERYQAAIAGITARLMEDLEIRELVARGMDDEVERRRQEIMHRRELDDAIRAGLDEATIARIEYVQALEREALAQRQAEEAAKKAAEAAQKLADFMADLTAREAALAGDEIGAVRARMEAQAANELKAAQELLDAGIITEEMFQRLAEVLDQEIARAIEDIIERTEVQSRAFRTDLAEREARAFGRDREALEIRLLAQREEELRQAEKLVEAGIITEEEFRRLAAVLDIEVVDALADFDDRLRVAADALNDFIGATFDDLEVRRLFAEGREEEARIRQKQIQQQQERERIWDQFHESIKDLPEDAVAEAMEKFARLWDELLEVQDLEMKRFLESIRDAGEAIGSGRSGRSATAAARESIASVSRISETTAIRVTDLIATSNVYLREIAGNTRRVPGDGIAWFPQPVTAAASGERVVVQITNHFPNVTRLEGDARTLGRQLGRGMADQINEELARRRRRDRTAGSTGGRG